MAHNETGRDPNMNNPLLVEVEVEINNGGGNNNRPGINWASIEVPNNHLEPYDNPSKERYFGPSIFSKNFNVDFSDAENFDTSRAIKRDKNSIVLPDYVWPHLLRNNTIGDAVQLKQVFGENVFKQFFRLNLNRKLLKELKTDAGLMAILRKQERARFQSKFTDLENQITQIERERNLNDKQKKDLEQKKSERRVLKAKMDLEEPTAEALFHCIFQDVAPHCRQLILKCPAIWNGFPNSLTHFTVLESFYLQVNENPLNEAFKKELFDKEYLKGGFKRLGLREMRMVAKGQENWALTDGKENFLYHDGNPLESFELLNSELHVFDAVGFYDKLKIFRTMFDDLDFGHGIIDRLMAKFNGLEFHVCWKSDKVTEDQMKLFNQKIRKLKDLQILALEFRWDAHSPQFEESKNKDLADLTKLPLDLKNLRKLSLDCDYNNFNMVKITNSDLIKKFQLRNTIYYLRIYISDLGVLPLSSNGTWKHLQTLELYFHEHKMYQTVWDRTAEENVWLTINKDQKLFQDKFSELKEITTLKLIHIPTFNNDLLKEIRETFPNLKKVAIKAARETLYQEDRMKNFVEFVEELKKLNTLVFEDNFSKQNMNGLLRAFNTRARTYRNQVFKVVFNDKELFEKNLQSNYTDSQTNVTAICFTNALLREGSQLENLRFH